MSALDTAKEIVRMANTAGLTKDVIDLLEKKSALLKEQVGMLENENTQLKLDNANLRQQLHRLQPVAHGLPDEQLAVLKVLESHERNWKPEEVATTLGIDVHRTHFLLTKLSKEKCSREFLTGFQITDKGREALHEPLP
jgi:regulator of replication initiation timing